MDREVVHKMFSDKNQKFAGSQMDRFLFTLCTKKAHFSATKGPPHEWCSTRCKILPLQLAPFSFTKMKAWERGRIPSYPCAGRYMEYGHDKSASSKESGAPLSTRIQEGTVVGWGKNQIREMDREVVHKMFSDKNQKFAGSQMDRFLFTSCTKKAHFFCHKGSPPRMVFYPLQDLAFAARRALLYKDASIRRGRIPSYPCAGRYIEYGHDKALHQRKGGSPSQLVFRNARLWAEKRTKFGKWIGKLFIRWLVTKIKNSQGPKWTDFFLLRALKKHMFSATKGPPHEWCSTRCKILRALLYKDASIRKRKDSFIPLRGKMPR